MVRLTADLLLAAPVRFNPAQDRELVLRGLKAPSIENLGVLRDQFDCLDLTDNDLSKLENFPLMKRLRTLVVANNRISRVADGLGAALPNLVNLVLTNNRVGHLAEVEALASLTSLQSLSLLGNPIIRKQHYRYYVIYKLPSLGVLDFQRVRRKERIAAAKLFNSKAGRAFAEEVSKTRYQLQAPAEAAAAAAAGDSSSSSAAAAPSFTAEQLAAIQAAISDASTREEVEALEAYLRKGQFPPHLVPVAAADSDLGTGEGRLDAVDAGAGPASSSRSSSNSAADLGPGAGAGAASTDDADIIGNGQLGRPEQEEGAGVSAGLGSGARGGPPTVPEEAMDTS